MSAASGIHSSVSGAGHPVVLLHGLFGMGSNLGALARALTPTFEVHQLDLPNHGRSAWMDSMNIPSLGEAIGAYCAEKDLDRPVLIGHSLGGKVAMQRALQAPQAVAALVVADIAPVTYQPSHGAVFQAIDAVIQARPQSRSEAAACMRKYLQIEDVVQFLLLSLKRDEAGAYIWRFNARVLQAAYPQLLAAPQGGSYGGPALFIHGAESPYVDVRGEAAARSLFPAATFKVLADTGHWLHAEKPDEFNAAVQAFLGDAVEISKARVRAPEQGAGQR